MKKTILQLVRNTAIVLLITAALAGTIEGIARFLFPENSSSINIDSSWVGTDLAKEDPVLGYKLKPSKTTAEYRINSMGFRGPEITPEKPANVFRVICFGGSTTIGSNAGDNQYTYPQILEDILNSMLTDCTKRVQVINAGVFGYHSWHSLMLFREIHKKLKPDLIVLMDGLNDIRAASDLSIADLLSNSLRRERVMSALVGINKGSSGQLQSFLLSLRSVKVTLHYISSYIAHDKLLWWKLSKFGFKKNLEALVDEAKQNNVSVLLVNYPWIVSDNLNTDGELERIPYRPLSDDLIHLYKFGRTHIKTINEDVSVRTHTPLVDPQPFIDAATRDKHATESVFCDTMHFTRLGNYIIAKTVVDGMVTMDLFKNFTSECNNFFQNYWEFKPKDAFRDIFAWADNTDKKGCENLYINNELPKMRNITMENIQVNPAESGWSMFRVIDPSKDGKIHFMIQSGKFIWRHPVIFPRVHNPDERVQLRMLDQGEYRTLIDFTSKDTKPGWTQMKLAYPIDLPQQPGEQVFEICLKGENAQYWTYNYAPIFLDAVQ